MKNGSMKIVSEARDDSFEIKMLTNYLYFDNGIEKGKISKRFYIKKYLSFLVRDKCKNIMKLMNNEKYLQQERMGAKNIGNYELSKQLASDSPESNFIFIEKCELLIIRNEV